MNVLTKFMEDKVQPAAGKLAEQKHLKILQDALFPFVPLLMLGSFALLIITPPVDYSLLNEGFAQRFFYGWHLAASALTPFLKPVYTATTGAVALYVNGGIGFYMGKHYGMEGMLPVAVTEAAFLALISIHTGGVPDVSLFGINGMFTAIVSGFLAAELYRFLNQKKVGYWNLEAKKVPDAITGVAADLIQIGIVFLCFTAFGGLVYRLSGHAVPELTGLIFTPLMKMINHPAGLLFLLLLSNLFWWFGIHDAAITAPLAPLLVANMLYNVSAYAAGASPGELPYVVTQSFYWSTVLVGGNGCLLALGILCLTSKSKQIKTIGKLGIVPAMFNIMEPLLFGLPIIYNPYFFFPFMVCNALCGGVFYLASVLGIVNHTFVDPGWNMPTPLNAFFSTMDYRALLLSVLLFFVCMAIYYPFFKAYETKKMAEEQSGI